jgi:hypothetical protein
MLHLVAGLEQGGGDALRLQLPVSSDPQVPGSAADLAQKALQQGYAALEYETRVGDQTFAWYHGPFVPHPIEPFTGLPPFTSSAAATIYDAATGTFDLSYAAGWEIGRLLALSDRAYSTSQARARKALRKVVNLVRERGRTDAIEDGVGLGELLRPDHVSSSFVGWLGNELAERLPRSGVGAVRPSPQADFQASPPPQPAAAELRALLGQRPVQALLEQHAAAAIEDGPLSDVADWLAHLRLLDGVPFAHLVADARMLKPESIRFFYVDPNFLDALCDGAQSVGIHSSRDALQHQLVRGVIRDAAIERAAARRAKLLGAAAEGEAGDPVAGFVLRSAVVSGWPGLEVRAFEQVDGESGAGLIKPVRMDRLAPDLLLCLYPTVPAWIEIDEPKEGLAFGVEDENTVDLRYLAGDNAGDVIPGATITLTSDYLRDTTRVVDVDAWQAYVAGQQASFAQYWGPAAFGIQMVRAPEQMIFSNAQSGAPEESDG